MIVYADTKRLAIRLPIAVATALPPAAAILRGTLGRRSARCSGWARARRRAFPRRPARARERSSAPQAGDEQRDAARDHRDQDRADQDQTAGVMPELQPDVQGVAPPVVELADQIAQVGANQIDIVLQLPDLVPPVAHANRSFVK